MNNYDPRAVRMRGASPAEGAADDEADPPAFEATSGPGVAAAQPVQVDELLGDVASPTTSEPDEEPPITVTVAQSPVQPVGPPGPNVARLIAIGVAVLASLGGLAFWRKRRSADA